MHIQIVFTVAEKTPLLQYRQTGEPEFENISEQDLIFKRMKDESEVIIDAGDYGITYMHVWNGVIPSLEIVAPRLTHLKIWNITDSTQLQKYLCCLQLECNSSYTVHIKLLPIV